MFKEGKKAQATTEFAVLGSLILVFFSFLISYSERLNREQSHIQQTFRATLKEAHNVGGSASFTKLAFRRMPNVISPYELGQLESFSSSASVLWGTKDDSIAKYQLNEDSPIQYTPRKKIPPGTTETSTNQFSHAVNAQVATLRQTSPEGKIITTKTLNAKDNLIADVTIDGKSYHFEQKLGDRGKYSSSGQGITRSVTLE